MKIAPFVAAVSAQLPDLGNFDLSSFDLSQFGLGPALPAVEVPVPAAVNADDFAVPADDERYFFTNPATTSTTTTTTSTTPPDGDSCWKCDQMTHTECSTDGRPETCTKGDKDCCFIEVRETAQKLQQLCMGCKSKDACGNLKDENFAYNVRNQLNRNQCKPDYRQQRFSRFNRNVQSVCRQCFNTCQASNPTGCFGASLTPGAHQQIHYDFSANPGFYGWTNHYNQGDFLGFGIVIGSVVDNTDGVNADISAGSNDITNIYHEGTGPSKTHPGGSNSNIYWGIHGATHDWWASDLKAIQNKVAAKNNNLVGGVPTPLAVDSADVKP